MNLKSVPNDSDDTPEEPVKFTFEDNLLDHGRMVRRLINEHGLEDQAAVNLFAVTLNAQLARQQMGG